MLRRPCQLRPPGKAIVSSATIRQPALCSQPALNRAREKINGAPAPFIPVGPQDSSDTPLGRLRIHGFAYYSAAWQSHSLFCHHQTAGALFATSVKPSEGEKLPHNPNFFLAGDLSVFGRLKTHSLAACHRSQRSPYPVYSRGTAGLDVTPACRKKIVQGPESMSPLHRKPLRPPKTWVESKDAGGQPPYKSPPRTTLAAQFNLPSKLIALYLDGWIGTDVYALLRSIFAMYEPSASMLTASSIDW
ncbi:hypothetical protein Bbelb_053880 [Branchiostoma belcheri]|nr:hypothetical protein Bbelb_053880 [Branchiostoma belcheri]